MRIGVYLDNYIPASGGSYVFQQTILREMDALKSKHTFFIFHWGAFVEYNFAKLPFIDLTDARKEEYRKEYTIKKALREAKNRVKPRIIKSALDRVIKFARDIAKIFSRKAIPEEEISLLDRAVKKYSIDVVWFLTPVFQNVSVPFFYTVWDLQHRVQPYFPEVSITGWKWKPREDNYKCVLPRAAKIITGTNAGKNEIVHYYRVNPDNVAVVPFPVPHFDEKHDISLDKDIFHKYDLPQKYLFYPAQFWPHKNHVNILHALKILKETSQFDIAVVFAGSDKGNESYIKETAEALGLSQNVFFLGFVPIEDLIQLYKNALALVFATFFGPDNIPPLEAFVLGCPVLASSVAGAAEQFGDAAIYFDPKNPEELADAICLIYKNQELRQELIEKGLKKAAERDRHAYLSGMCPLFDEFERIRRCWKNNYLHL